MTKKQARAHPKRAKAKKQDELAALKAQQKADDTNVIATDADVDDLRDDTDTVVAVDDDDGPLSLRDDVNLENDKSAGFGLTAADKAEDRRLQYVPRIKGEKGIGARPRRGEAFGRRHLLDRPSHAKGWMPPSARSADFKAMWTGDVGGVWVGLRQIKVVYRLVYDVPNTPPRRFLHYISVEAADLPILKYRHLIHSRKSAGWAGTRDSVPPREFAWFVWQNIWANECREGLKGRLAWFTQYLWLKETAPPPEVSLAVEACFELLADIWRSASDEEARKKSKASYKRALVEWADARFPELQPTARYQPPKPARRASLNRDCQRYYDYRRRGKAENRKRWSSAVADVNGQLKRNIKAFERANRREAKREWAEVAPHQYVNKKAALMLWPSEGCAKRRWQPVLWKREQKPLADCYPFVWQPGYVPSTPYERLLLFARPWRPTPQKHKQRLAPPTAYPPERPITESQNCTSVYDCRSTLAATDPTDPWCPAWRGWRLFLEGALKPRAPLSALVQDFLDRGGEIKICAPEKLSVEKRERGRPPIGEAKMSNSEKQRRYRANKKLKMQTSPTLSTTQTASAVGAGVVGPCPTRAVDAGILSVAKDKP